MQKNSVLTKNAVAILLGVLLLAGLYLTSLYNYLLFHSLVELFTIVVAAGIFMIAWNARAYLNNNYLLFRGHCSRLHRLPGYVPHPGLSGHGRLRGPTANTATQLWVARQYLQGLSLLVAPFFIGRKLKVSLQLGPTCSSPACCSASIFAWHIFPVAYVQGRGLTAFKIASEYIIVVFFLASIGILLMETPGIRPGRAALPDPVPGLYDRLRDRLHFVCQRLRGRQPGRSSAAPGGLLSSCIKPSSRPGW